MPRRIPFFKISIYQDYKALPSDQISDHQYKRCEQIERGVKAHLQEGKERIYSDACPLRLWASILKEHKEGPEMMKLFIRECDSRNGKYGFDLDCFFFGSLKRMYANAKRRMII